MAEDTSSVLPCIGIDLGDRYSHVCVLDTTGEIVDEGRVRTTPETLRERFGGCGPYRIAIEVGTHSPWISRLLTDCGHEVIVANARKLRLIYENDKKNDRVDAEYLARLVRVDPRLLAPLRHRKVETQADLALLRARDCLVRARTQLVVHVRGAVKSFGARLPKCDVRTFPKHVAPHLPDELKPALLPLLQEIASITARVREMEKQLNKMIEDRYPEAERLLQVNGVGLLTALTYLLTLEDPRRFTKSRSVASFLGLTPRQRDSGEQRPQLRITKAGDANLRKLLVNCGNYILGPFGSPSDLRTWGLKLAERGGKNAKKKAVVAVARKLAALLHRLWMNGETYEPIRAVDKRRRRTA